MRWYRKREASLEDEENRSGGEDDDLGDLHYGDNIREDAVIVKRDTTMMMKTTMRRMRRKNSQEDFIAISLAELRGR